MEDWLIMKIKNNTIMMEAANDAETNKYYQGKINAFRSSLEKCREWNSDQDMIAKENAEREDLARDRENDFEPDINS